MTNYSLYVQANVISQYGGNVYAVAFKQNYFFSDIELVENFVLQNKNHIKLMQSIIPNRNSPTITCRTFITEMFDNVGSIEKHSIEYDFSDYSVFIVVENQLGLTQSGYTGRFNAYSDVLREEDIVTNTLIVFADQVGKNFSTNRITFTSTIVETVDYRIIGFVDDPTDPDYIIGYVDQLKEYETIYGPNDQFVQKLSVFGRANQPTLTISTDKPITHVVKNTNVFQEESLYHIDDINNAVFYVYAKSVATGNVTLTRHHLFEESNIAHVRIKGLEFTSDYQRLQVNVSAFSWYGTPTEWQTLVIENKHYHTLSEADIESNFTTYQTYTQITGSDLQKTVLHNTLELSNGINDQGVFTSIRSDLEYIAIVRIVIDNTIYNDTTILYANLDSFTIDHNNITFDFSIYDTPKIESVITVNNETSLQIDVSVYDHPVDDIYTYANVGVSTVPNLVSIDDSLTRWQFVVENDETIHTETVYTTQIKDSTGVLVDVDAVNSIRYYEFVHTEDIDASYSITRPITTKDILSDPSTPVFPKFQQSPVLEGYDKIRANITSIFNNTTNILTGLKMFVRESQSNYGDSSVLYDVNNTSVPSYAVDVLNHNVLFSKVFVGTHTLDQLSVGRDYEFVTMLGDQQHIFSVDISSMPGILSFSKEFDNDGYIKISSISLQNANNNQYLYGIAFTYDVFEYLQSNIDTFQQTIRNHSFKNIISTNPNLIDNNYIYTLTKVVDIENRNESSYGTNTGFVYLWLESTINNQYQSAINIQQISTVDYLYIHLPDDALTIDFASITVSGGTMIESNILTTTDVKIDRYYIYLTKSNGKVESGHAISYFNQFNPTLTKFFGVYHDISPDVDLHSIYNVSDATNLKTALIYDEDNVVVEERILYNTEYVATLVGINTDNYPKSIYSNVFNSGTLDYILDLTVTDYVNTVEFTSNVRNVSHQFKIALFTYKQYTLSFTNSSLYSLYVNDVSTHTQITDSLSVGYDGSDTNQPISYTNNLFAYAWLEGDNGEVTPAVEYIVKESSSMYPLMYSVNTNDGTAIISAYMPFTFVSDASTFDIIIHPYDPKYSIDTNSVDAFATSQTFVHTSYERNKVVYDTLTLSVPVHANVAYDVVYIMKASTGELEKYRVTQQIAPSINNVTFVLDDYVVDFNAIQLSDTLAIANANVVSSSNIFRMSLYTSRQNTTVFDNNSLYLFSTTEGTGGYSTSTSQLYDGSNTLVSFEYVNNVYAYAWIQYPDGSTTPAVEDIVRSTTNIYHPIYSVNTNNNVANVSIFAPDTVGTSLGYVVYPYKPSESNDADAESKIISYPYNTNRVIIETSSLTSTVYANVAYDIVMIVKTNDNVISKTRITQDYAPIVQTTTYVLDDYIRYFNVNDELTQLNLYASVQSTTNVFKFGLFTTKQNIYSITENSYSSLTDGKIQTNLSEAYEGSNTYISIVYVNSLYAYAWIEYADGSTTPAVEYVVRQSENPYPIVYSANGVTGVTNVSAFMPFLDSSPNTTFGFVIHLYDPLTVSESSADSTAAEQWTQRFDAATLTMYDTNRVVIVTDSLTSTVDANVAADVVMYAKATSGQTAVYRVTQSVAPTVAVAAYVPDYGYYESDAIDMRIFNVDADRKRTRVSVFMPSEDPSATYGFVVYPYDPTTPYATVLAEAERRIGSKTYPSNRAELRIASLFEVDVVFDVMVMMKTSGGTIATETVTQTVAPAIGATTFVLEDYIVSFEVTEDADRSARVETTVVSGDKEFRMALFTYPQTITTESLYSFSVAAGTATGTFATTLESGYDGTDTLATIGYSNNWYAYAWLEMGGGETSPVIEYVAKQSDRMYPLVHRIDTSDSIANVSAFMPESFHSEASTFDILIYPYNPNLIDLFYVDQNAYKTPFVHTGYNKNVVVFDTFTMNETVQPNVAYDVLLVMKANNGMTEEYRVTQEMAPQFMSVNVNLDSYIVDFTVVQQERDWMVWMIDVVSKSNDMKAGFFTSKQNRYTFNDQSPYNLRWSIFRDSGTVTNKHTSMYNWLYDNTVITYPELIYPDSEYKQTRLLRYVNNLFAYAWIEYPDGTTTPAVEVIVRETDEVYHGVIQIDCVNKTIQMHSFMPETNDGITYGIGIYPYIPENPEYTISIDTTVYEKNAIHLNTLSFEHENYTFDLAVVIQTSNQEMNTIYVTQEEAPMIHDTVYVVNDLITYLQVNDSLVLGEYNITTIVENTSSKELRVGFYTRKQSRSYFKETTTYAYSTQIVNDSLISFDISNIVYNYHNELLNGNVYTSSTSYVNNLIAYAWIQEYGERTDYPLATEFIMKDNFEIYPQIYNVNTITGEANISVFMPFDYGEYYRYVVYPYTPSAPDESIMEDVYSIWLTKPDKYDDIVYVETSTIDKPVVVNEAMDVMIYARAFIDTPYDYDDMDRTIFLSSVKTSIFRVTQKVAPSISDDSFYIPNYTYFQHDPTLLEPVIHRIYGMDGLADVYVFMPVSFETDTSTFSFVVYPYDPVVTSNVYTEALDLVIEQSSRNEYNYPVNNEILRTMDMGTFQYAYNVLMMVRTSGGQIVTTNVIQTDAPSIGTSSVVLDDYVIDFVGVYANESSVELYANVESTTNTFHVALVTSQRSKESFNAQSPDSYSVIVSSINGVVSATTSVIFDSTNSAMNVSYVNNIYAYAWIEYAEGGITPVVEIKVHESDVMYPRIHSVNSVARTAYVSGFMPIRSTDTNFGFSIVGYKPETQVILPEIVAYPYEKDVVVLETLTINDVTEYTFDIAMIIKSSTGDVVEYQITQETAPQIESSSFVVDDYIMQFDAVQISTDVVNMHITIQSNAFEIKMGLFTSKQTHDTIKTSRYAFVDTIDTGISDYTANITYLFDGLGDQVLLKYTNNIYAYTWIENSSGIVKNIAEVILQSNNEMYPKIHNIDTNRGEANISLFMPNTFEGLENMEFYSILRINGTESYSTPIMYNKYSFTPPNYEFTFSGWFMISSEYQNNPGGFDIHMFLDGGKNGIELMSWDATRYQIKIYANGAPHTAEIIVNIGEWVFITFVSDKNGNWVKCYKNAIYFGGGRDYWARYYEDTSYFGTRFGQRDQSLNWHSVNLRSSNSAYNWSTSKMNITNRWGIYNLPINASFAKFALWHSPLTQEQITDLYSNGDGWRLRNSIYSSNDIYGYWSLENTLEDVVNGNHFEQDQVSDKEPTFEGISAYNYVVYPYTPGNSNAIHEAENLLGLNNETIYTNDDITLDTVSVDYASNVAFNMLILMKSANDVRELFYVTQEDAPSVGEVQLTDFYNFITNFDTTQKTNTMTISADVFTDQVFKVGLFTYKKPRYDFTNSIYSYTTTTLHSIEHVTFDINNVYDGDNDLYSLSYVNNLYVYAWIEYADGVTAPAIEIHAIQSENPYPIVYSANGVTGVTNVSAFMPFLDSSPNTTFGFVIHLYDPLTVSESSADSTAAEQWTQRFDAATLTMYDTNRVVIVTDSLTSTVDANVAADVVMYAKATSGQTAVYRVTQSVAPTVAVAAYVPDYGYYESDAIDMRIFNVDADRKRTRVSVFMPSEDPSATYGFVVYPYDPTTPYATVLAEAERRIGSKTYPSNRAELRIASLFEVDVVFDVMVMMKTSGGTIATETVTQTVAPAIGATTFVLEDYIVSFEVTEDADRSARVETTVVSGDKEFRMALFTYPQTITTESLYSFSVAAGTATGTFATTLESGYDGTDTLATIGYSNNWYAYAWLEMGGGETSPVIEYVTKQSDEIDLRLLNINGTEGLATVSNFMPYSYNATEYRYIIHPYSPVYNTWEGDQQANTLWTNQYSSLLTYNKNQVYLNDIHMTTNMEANVAYDLVVYMKTDDQHVFTKRMLQKDAPSIKTLEPFADYSYYRNEDDLYPKIHKIDEQISHVSLFMPESFEGFNFGYIVYTYNPIESDLSIMDVSTMITESSMYYSKNTEILRSIFLKNDSIMYNVLLVMKTTNGDIAYNHITQDIAPAILSTVYVI